MANKKQKFYCGCIKNTETRTQKHLQWYCLKNLRMGFSRIVGMSCCFTSGWLNIRNITGLKRAGNKIKWTIVVWLSHIAPILFAVYRKTLLNTPYTFSEFIAVQKFFLVLLKKDKLTKDTVPCAINVAKAAPLIPYIGINHKLQPTFNIAPKVVM